MLFWEVIAVYSENPKKHIKNTVTKMQRLISVKAGDTYSCYWTLNV